MMESDQHIAEDQYNVSACNRERELVQTSKLWTGVEFSSSCLFYINMLMPTPDLIYVQSKMIMISGMSRCPNLNNNDSDIYK